MVSQGPNTNEEQDRAAAGGQAVDSAVLDERAVQEGAAPTPEQLVAVQEAIEQHVEEGATPVATELLVDLRTPDQAEILAELQPETKQAVLGSLSAERIADILEHMDVEDAVEVSGLVDIDKLASVLDRAEPDVAADVLRGLGWPDASRILMRMSDRGPISNLLTYHDDDAGGLMTTNVVALRDSWPVPHAINMLRTSGLDHDELRQLFVISSSDELVGRLELPELVFARPGALVRDVMRTDVISVAPGTDQEEAARLMQRYELRSLPVVGPTGQLEGAISIEDVFQVAEEEATEDMLRLAGTTGEDVAIGPVSRSVRSRLPWLLANIVTVIAVAAVLSAFESTLDAIAILAVYMPMVMNQSGVAGTQVTTVVVRSLALGDVTTSNTARILRREYVLAAVNGGVVAGIMAIVVGLWRNDLYLGLVILIAMFASYFVAASVGVMVPMGMRRFRIDPATASGVVLTTFTDIAGGAFYLGLATVFLSLLRQ